MLPMMVEFAAREDVAGQRRELLALLAGARLPALAGPGDGVVQEQAAGFQQPVDRLVIGREIVDADMFEHADARHLVEARSPSTSA